VCVICDRVIIGVEKIEQITKQRLIDNQHRLSVEAFESFFDIELNPILKEQYQLDDNDLHGMLLSPRAYRLSNGKYECCEACYRSLRPNRVCSGFKPPKHAIANGFAIGYIPSELWICGEENPREFGISDELISDMSMQQWQYSAPTRMCLHLLVAHISQLRAILFFRDKSRAFE
jgi:hypothetical protein